MVVNRIVPDWPAPPTVHALQTTRQGGFSRGPWEGFNLGDHVGDDPAAVAANRDLLRAFLPAEPLWLRQVHGSVVVDAASVTAGAEADAVMARIIRQVCVVMTADCLPLLLCDRAGSIVAAVHAGWRGLAAGVIEATLVALARPPEDILVWLGPAIGPRRFEVGDDVRDACLRGDGRAGEAFAQQAPGKWLADIEALARLRLARAGVDAIFGGGLCTFSDPLRFFSHRRDGVSGRQASFIWLEAAGV